MATKLDDLLVVATRDGLRVFERPLEEAREVLHTLKNQHVTTVSRQGQTLLAGTTAGLFRSTDLGQTWYAAKYGLTESHLRWVSYHPERQGLALAGAEPASIFYTEDNARTWRACYEVAELRDENKWYLPYSPEAGCVRGFAFHGDRAYAAVEQGGLLRSDDAGQHWHLVAGSTGDPQASIPEGYLHTDVHSVAVHPSSSDWVVAPTGGGLYRSQDGGANWEHLYDCYCRAAWLDPDDAAHMIFGPADGVDERGRIEETFDGGATWRPANEGTAASWLNHMVERLIQWDDTLLAVLSNGHMLATDLSEIVWQRVLPEIDDARALAVPSRGLGTSRGVIRSKSN